MLGSAQITQLLMAWSNRDEAALRSLIPLVYEELRRIARRHMRLERRGHTLQTTGLVNEAYMRLVAVKSASCENRAQFFALCAQLMRRILVDHARSRGYAKRGGGACRVALEEALAVNGERDMEVLALNDALTALSSLDPRKGRVVELRFFGGLSVDDTADVLKVSPDTVKRDWRLAKLWLSRELKKVNREGSNGP
jgi:RNA polymerase sigma factor (TIGR02999 family)